MILFRLSYDRASTEMNGQGSLIRGIMLYDFELNHNAAKGKREFLRNMKAQLITEQCEDGSRDFNQFVSTSTIIQDQVSLKS